MKSGTNARVQFYAEYVGFLYLCLSNEKRTHYCSSKYFNLSIHDCCCYLLQYAFSYISCKDFSFVVAACRRQVEFSLVVIDEWMDGEGL